MFDELERDAFDLVHCRLLLHHLRGKQVEAVQRMASTLRPGGIFIASECYFGAMRASCTRAFAELWRGLYAALPNADYEWPVSLPATLQAAGLEAVDARGDVGLIRGGTPESEILRPSVDLRAWHRLVSRLGQAKVAMDSVLSEVTGVGGIRPMSSPAGLVVRRRRRGRAVLHARPPNAVRPARCGAGRIGGPRRRGRGGASGERR
jgi:Methyltransferase domain